MGFPKAGLLENRRKGNLRAVEGAVQAVEKPREPGRQVETTFLRLFQHVVVRIPLQTYLGGHAVKPLRAILRPCKRHIGDRARDTSVAIVERMDGDKPEMGEARFQHGINRRRTIKPFQESCHFPLQVFGGNCLIVDAFVTDRPGNYLYRAGRDRAARARKFRTPIGRTLHGD
jgi:hypothetical protein